MKTKMMWTCKKSFWAFLMLSMVTLLSAGVVEFPLIQSMTYFPYAEHSLLDRSDMSVNLGLYYSNVYMFERNGEVTPVVNDFEVSSPTLELRYGLVKGVTLEVFYRISSVFGGELDKLIENFHDSFNLPDNQRPKYPRNAVHYRYRDYFQYYQRKNFVSPLVFSCLAGIVDRPGFSIKSRLALGIPLAEMPGFVSAKPFLTTGLIMGFGGEKFSLDMSAYLSFFKQPLWLEDVDMSSQIFLTDIRLGLGRFLAGFVYRTSPFKEGDIAHDARQLYVGYRFGNSVELILFEDLAPFDTSPDISVSLRFKLL